MGQASASDDVYETLIAMLADMVESAAVEQRYIVVKKPCIDPIRWVERQMRLEERMRVEHELTAQLLGTHNFTRIG